MRIFVWIGSCSGIWTCLGDGSIVCNVFLLNRVWVRSLYRSSGCRIRVRRYLHHSSALPQLGRCRGEWSERLMGASRPTAICRMLVVCCDPHNLPLINIFPSLFPVSVVLIIAFMRL